MKRINMHDAKSNLSRYIEELQAGEEIVLCRRNVPVARIVPVEGASRSETRPVGLARDQFEVPEAFFEPLPEDITESFSGVYGDGDVHGADGGNRGGGMNPAGGRQR